MVSRAFLLSILVAVMAALSADAFVPQQSAVVVSRAATTPAFVFGKNKKKAAEDLSDIEVRDMTRGEMQELNAKNEEVMNMELSMMTGFSLIISLPILYLCWVAFFSE
jgi:selenocysteine-specific elongation factor